MDLNNWLLNWCGQINVYDTEKERIRTFSSYFLQNKFYSYGNVSTVTSPESNFSYGNVSTVTFPKTNFTVMVMYQQLLPLK